MTRVEAIRAYKPSQTYTEPWSGKKCYSIYDATMFSGIMLQEIAAQLAEINAKLPLPKPPRRKKNANTTAVSASTPSDNRVPGSRT